MITKSGGIERMVQSMLRFPDDLEIQDTRWLAATVRTEVQSLPSELETSQLNRMIP